jgi:hypothetical protein
MENKMKHLEFIQAVITRMNTNSFMIKGWAVTLISALFALAAKDANQKYVIVAYIPLGMFWVLDGFFLCQERQYRKLYDKVRRLSESRIDFSMNATEFNNEDRTWFNGIISKTLYPFYGTLLAITIVVTFFFTSNTFTK